MIILLKRIFAITSCYLQQAGANGAIITAISQNWAQSKDDFKMLLLMLK